MDRVRPRRAGGAVRRAGLRRASGLRQAAHRVQAVSSMGERGVGKGELGARVTGSMARRRDLYGERGEGASVSPLRGRVFKDQRGGNQDERVAARKDPRTNEDEEWEQPIERNDEQGGR